MEEDITDCVKKFPSRNSPWIAVKEQEKFYVVVEQNVLCEACFFCYLLTTFFI